MNTLNVVTKFSADNFDISYCLRKYSGYGKIKLIIYFLRHFFSVLGIVKWCRISTWIRLKTELKCQTCTQDFYFYILSIEAWVAFIHAGVRLQWTGKNTFFPEHPVWLLSLIHPFFNQDKSLVQQTHITRTKVIFFISYINIIYIYYDNLCRIISLTTETYPPPPSPS